MLHPSPSLLGEGQGWGPCLWTIPMPGKILPRTRSPRRQNAAIMAVFERAGFEHIAPDIIQPADIFLERSVKTSVHGLLSSPIPPAMNCACARTDGACLPLSPEPCRKARSRYPLLLPGHGLSLSGRTALPQEFNQAGIEWYGGDNAIEAEARIIKLAISALEAAGLSKLK